MDTPCFVMLLLALVPVAIGLFISHRHYGAMKPGVKRGLPVCGACRYPVAANPSGLTRCPECGGDYREVGIFRPGMGSGVLWERWALPVVYVFICYVGAVLLHAGMKEAFNKPVTERTEKWSISFVGLPPGSVLDGCTLQADYEAEGVEMGRSMRRSTVFESTLALELSDVNGVKKWSAVVDNLSGTITNAQGPNARAVIGRKFDYLTADMLLTGATTPPKLPSNDASAMHATVSRLMTPHEQRALYLSNPTLGWGGTTSSSSGLVRSNFSMSGTLSSNATASSTGTNSTNNRFVLGSLRGDQWLLAIVAAVTAAAMVVGLLLIGHARR